MWIDALVDHYVAHPKRQRQRGSIVPGHYENIKNREVHDVVTALGLCTQWAMELDAATPPLSCAKVKSSNGSRKRASCIINAGETISTKQLQNEIGFLGEEVEYLWLNITSVHSLAGRARQIIQNATFSCGCGELFIPMNQVSVGIGCTDLVQQLGNVRV